MPHVTEPRQSTAIFTEGSTTRHVLVMSVTGSIGTMALFFVDFAELYFLSLLGKTEVTAAVGYSRSILLFELSVALGVGTAVVALVSRSYGSGEKERAREYAASSFLVAILTSAAIALVIVLLSDRLLSLMGAEGETKYLAKRFIWIVSPGYVLWAGSFCLGSILRGFGDARRAMYVTISAAVVMLVLDPIFIFILGWGILGAAIAMVLANAVSLAVGLYGVVRVHNALGPIRWGGLVNDKSDIWAIAYPATLTLFTVPLANAYITYVMARFGDEAVAGFAIICRLAPVAFGAVFALSSAAGPIIGQNFGAGLHGRVRSTITHSLVLSSVYVLCMALFLLVLSEQITASFGAFGVSHDLVIFFCSFIGGSWAFIGAQFVAGAAFVSLGHPRLAAVFSWGRIGLGTVPFVWFGAMWGGPKGVLIGSAAEVVVFGSAAAAVAYRLIASKSKLSDCRAESDIAR